jgi:hypothetical protein
LEAAGSKFRLLIAIEHSQILAIACFTYAKTIRRYEIVAKKLFDLSVTEVSLFGSCVLGQPSETVIRKIFELIIDKSDFDLIRVGEIRIDSPLYNVITGLRHGAIVWGARRTLTQWLIRLPPTFDGYIASLRSSTRRAIFKDRRRFERQSSKFHVVQFSNEVEAFLRDANKISRLTYQWNLGFGFCDDQNTRLWLTRSAQNGSLRCYIVYVQGEPCAFSWGELSHRTFVGHVTGYDPKFRELSPGTALLMWMIRDLIENTNCEVFDFKWGDREGYKSRYGTLSFRGRCMHVAKIHRPYSLLIVALDQALNLPKSLVENFLYLVFGHGALRQRLRRAMRRWGIATF